MYVCLMNEVSKVSTCMVMNVYMCISLLETLAANEEMDQPIDTEKKQRGSTYEIVHRSNITNVITWTDFRIWWNEKFEIKKNNMLHTQNE